MCNISKVYNLITLFLLYLTCIRYCSVCEHLFNPINSFFKLCIILNSLIPFFIFPLILSDRRSQWPRCLRRRSAAAGLLRSWVRIPPGAWMFVCCECCVLSGRGLCDELITRPEQSYRLWCVVVCYLENLKNEEAMTRAGSQRHRKKKLM